MTRDEIISKLEQAQDLLSDVYHYAISIENAQLESLMSTADGCICDGLDSIDYDEPDDGQPDEAQEWHDFDPEC